jgi:tetratricopeptide (TPR) repeat protein
MMYSDDQSSNQYQRFISYLPGLVLGAVAIALVAISQMRLPATYTIQRQLIPPPPHIERFAFGYQEVIADTLWIRALQDFDYCDSKIAENVCRNNSWLFQMLDSITNLSPNFRIPYAAGALALTVIITDIDGATKIFDKGVKAFPNDWPLLYRAAYHYLYEVNDKKRAAELLIAAGKNGAPSWVFSLAGRLYSDAGKVDLAKALLEQMIQEKQDPTLVERVRKKIESIEAAEKTDAKPK